MRLLFFLIVAIAMARGKIVIDKWEIQHDKTISDMTYEVKDKTSMTVDVHPLVDADDVMLEIAAYSKVDGTYNPFVKPDPVHICKVHEHEEPMVKFMHDEILKYGNITKACPMTKGAYYYMHDFVVDEEKFPMPLPAGEFRIDVNVSIVVGGNVKHVSSSEMFFTTVK